MMELQSMKITLVLKMKTKMTTSMIKMKASSNKIFKLKLKKIQMKIQIFWPMALISKLFLKLNNKNLTRKLLIQNTLVNN